MKPSTLAALRRAGVKVPDQADQPKAKADKVPVIAEAEVQRSCLKILAMWGVLAWRSNSRVFIVPGKGGKERPMRAGLGKGSADIIGVMPDGRFLAVEVKRPGAKPKPDQIEWLSSVNRQGGLALWTTSELVLENIISRECCSGFRITVSIAANGDQTISEEDR